MPKNSKNRAASMAVGLQSVTNDAGCRFFGSRYWSLTLTLTLDLKIVFL